MADPQESVATRLSTRLQDPYGVLKDDPALLAELQKKVSEAMTRMATKPQNGGHPFLFALTAPKPHELAKKLPGSNNKGWKTAATDGRRYYWHPEFLQKLNAFEISIVMFHESYHVLYSHVRRGVGRNPQIWNLAIDYIVNSHIEHDHSETKRQGTLWGGEMGTPVPLKNLLSYIDGSLDQLMKGQKDGSLIFSDITCYGKSPEEVYDEIMKHIQKSPNKCPSCGSLGHKGGSKPQQKQGKGQGQQPGKGGQKGQQPGQGGQGQGQGDPQDGDGCGDGGGSCGHDHSQDQEDGCGGSGESSCPTCGGGLQSLDGHMDAGLTAEEAIAEAIRAAETVTKMRGTVPGGIKDLLGELEKPTLTWQDLVRHACMRKRIDVGNKNDWKRFRRRPMSFPVPQYMPRKHDHKPRVLACLDTSGSMSDDDLRYCVSQLAVLGNDMDLTIVPNDAEPYWDQATKVQNVQDLRSTKIKGRGGTTLQTFFQDYPKHMGTEFDVVIAMTDGYIDSIPEAYKPRQADTVWIYCNNEAHKPPFGRAAPLRTKKS